MKFLTTARFVIVLLLASVVFSACAREDPARAALRERIKVEGRLSDEDLTQLMDEASRGLEGKTVRIRDDAQTREPTPLERSVVLGMLENRAGVFDEGLRTDNGVVSRVLNAPGESPNAEIEATRRLWIDVETLLPRHFEFTFFISGLGDYSYDVIVQE